MLKVTAFLESPLLGDAPYLDAILEYEMAQRLGMANKVRRDHPVGQPGEIHIPMLRATIGGHSVPCCSAPIYVTHVDGVEHVAKRLATEHAGMLREASRNVVSVGNNTYKSYRLPLRRRVVQRVVWFCEAHRRHVVKLLKSVHSIGKKRSIGYGRIGRWGVEHADGEHWWYSRVQEGTVLMRALPLCSDLPRDLIGFRESFGACQAPMWHPQRYMEIVVPA